MKLVIMFALFAFAAAQISPIFQDRTTWPQWFASMDTNKDKVVTKKESQQEFKKLDSNNDNLVIWEEFVTGHEWELNTTSDFYVRFHFYDMLDGLWDNNIKLMNSDTIFNKLDGTRNGSFTEKQLKHHYLSKVQKDIENATNQANAEYAKLDLSLKTSTNVSLNFMFNYMDINRDHIITLHENSVEFRGLNTNNDSFVTWKELSANKTNVETNAVEVGRFNYYDKCDGDVDKRIHISTTKIIFDRLDTDKNGYMTRTEYFNNAPGLSNELREAGEVAANTFISTPDVMEARLQSTHMAEEFYNLDTNDDAVLSNFEFSIYFRFRDTNFDSILTLEEFFTKSPHCEQQNALTFALFNFYDNFDGAVDHFIPRATFDAIFNRMDVNQDGSVDTLEYTAGMCLIDNEFTESVIGICTYDGQEKDPNPAKKNNNKWNI